MTNQLGINFNAARESSTVASHILRDLYLSGQYYIKNNMKKQLCQIFLEFYIDQE